MGNETSSVKIHTLLTADDIKRLRAGFPDGGAGVKPPANLEWGPWKTAWPPKLRKRLEQLLSFISTKTQGPNQKQIGGEVNGISFNNYQELAGSCVRGTTEERVKLLFRLAVTENPPQTSAQVSSAKIAASVLATFVEDIINVASHLSIEHEVELQPELRKCAIRLAISLLHDLHFSGNKSRKECLHQQPDEDAILDFDAVERWTVMHCPLFDRIFRFVLAASFGLETGIEEFALLPIQDPKLQFKTGASDGLEPNTRLSPPDAFFLNCCLPSRELRQRWRLLFNSAKNGESFSKLQAAITNAKTSRTPTLIIVWEDGDEGHIFGGYASNPWAIGPKFFGENTSFLFTLNPRQYMYEATTYNTNYQYLNVKAKTMPNGLGMGGQLEYFGLWLDAEYGKGKCAPSCSSFAAPQLSKEENFTYHHVEVWGVGDEPQDEDEEDDSAGAGALNKDPEAMAVMEMMGKTFISKDVKAADENLEKQKKDEEQASDDK